MYSLTNMCAFTQFPLSLNWKSKYWFNKLSFCFCTTQQLNKHTDSLQQQQQLKKETNEKLLLLLVVLTEVGGGAQYLALRTDRRIDTHTRTFACEIYNINYPGL